MCRCRRREGCHPRVEPFFPVERKGSTRVSRSGAFFFGGEMQGKKPESWCQEPKICLCGAFYGKRLEANCREAGMWAAKYS